MSKQSLKVEFHWEFISIQNTIKLIYLPNHFETLFIIDVSMFNTKLTFLKLKEEKWKIIWMYAKALAVITFTTILYHHHEVNWNSFETKFSHLG